MVRFINIDLLWENCEMNGSVLATAHIELSATWNLIPRETQYDMPSTKAWAKHNFNRHFIVIGVELMVSTAAAHK